MDTVRGSRKYFQNVGVDNNYYRNSMNRSFLQTNYSSYQNTLGRSSMGPFTHTTCSIPYQNDVSLHSQYGYNSWGMWKDSRNLTPSSSYSSKSNRRSVRSFTILLMTAVFIVVIAIFGFAALAFYFSTYKADTNDSMMVFDGKFQVLKGDTFTTGLKYNHTSVFQQKAEQYQGMIVKSLEKSGMELFKCSILGFGDGPLINVIFRIIVDMRKIPLTIKSVEDHIKESIAKEASYKKSVFNNISVDLESISIQRLLDHDVLKSSSFISVETTTSHSEAFDDTKSEDRVINKATTTAKSKLQPKVDKSDMPIQGSFEVTKTDADIAQKKSPPTTTKTSTLRPFTISNTGMRIKTKKTTIEKVKHPTIQSTGISHVNKVTIESITEIPKKDNPPRTSTLRPLTTFETITVPNVIVANVTIAPNATNTTKKVTPMIDVNSKISTTTDSSTPSTPSPNIFQRRTNIENPPKLDANLFTTAPVIDDEPWLPINPINVMNSKEPINPTQNNYGTVITKTVNVQPTNDDDNPNGEFQFHIVPRNKIRFSEPFDDSFNREMLFHSFTNPAFTYLTSGIETLGSANLRPYPIPINKIVDEPNGPELETATPELNLRTKSEGEVSVNYESTKNVTANEPTSEATVTVTEEPTVLLGDVLLDLLGGKDNINKDLQQLTTVLPDTTTSFNFKNIKEFVLTTAKNNSSNTASSNIPPSQPSKVLVTKKQPTLSTSTLRDFAENETLPAKPTSYIEVETVQYTPVSESWNQPSLFPVQSKFEYVNGTLVSSFDTQTIRRIFNETLHAWIVENSQKVKVDDNEEIFARKNNSHIQNISAIFDTLASELGVQPNISTKMPPFVTSPHNKKMTHVVSDEHKKQDNKLSDPTPTTVTAFQSSTDKLIPSKGDVTYGEAEIEEVDPTQYEQILLSNIRVTSTTVPSLITLMPVKSNSGIRQRRPIIDKLKMSHRSRSRLESI